MLHLDGSCFSGSGTIVRFGVPLAALTGQDLHLFNIRARRQPPGLRPQHLKAVESVAQLCQATLEGGTVGSRELFFRPGRLPQVTDHVHANSWLVETILGARVHLEGQLLCVQGVGYGSPG